jgi:hypothetical protein
MHYQWWFSVLLCFHMIINNSSLFMSMLNLLSININTMDIKRPHVNLPFSYPCWWIKEGTFYIPVHFLFYFILFFQFCGFESWAIFLNFKAFFGGSKLLSKTRISKKNKISNFLSVKKKITARLHTYPREKKRKEKKTQRWKLERLIPEGLFARAQFQMHHNNNNNNPYHCFVGESDCGGLTPWSATPIHFTQVVHGKHPIAQRNQRQTITRRCL